MVAINRSTPNMKDILSTSLTNGAPLIYFTKTLFFFAKFLAIFSLSDLIDVFILFYTFLSFNVV